MNKYFKIGSQFWKKLICMTVVGVILLFIQYEAYIYLASSIKAVERWVLLLITIIPAIIIGIAYFRRMLKKGCAFG